MFKKICKATLGILIGALIAVPAFADDEIIVAEVTDEIIATDSDEDIAAVDFTADDIEAEVVVTEETQDEVEVLFDEDSASNASSGKAGTNVTYTISGDVIYLSGSGETSKFDPKISVPSAIKKAVIGDGIVNINSNLFKEWDNLEDVTIAGSVKTIGNSAFYRCKSLKKVNLNEGLTKIGASSFQYCNSLETIKLPSTVTLLDEYCFADSISLKEADLNEGLSSIKYRAFRGCASLEKINIPSTMEQNAIGIEVFKGCEKLKTYGPVGGNYNVTASNVYENGRFAYLVSVVVPGTSVNVAYKAFDNCDSLETVVVEPGVKTVGSSAFYDCGSLKSVTLPDGITSIGNSAFSKCSSLETIAVPGTCTTLDDYSFMDCISLREVKLNEGLTFIKHRAFKGCASLEKINIPSTVGQKNISTEAFRDCEKLKTYGPAGGDYNVTASNVYEYSRFSYVESVVIPKTSINIPDRAFYDCNSLQSVIIEKGIKTIGYEAFADCDNLRSVTLPYGVTSIGNRAFSANKALEKISIPSSVKSIADYGFYNNVSLKSVTLNEGLNSIGYKAFDSCPSLKKVIIPSSVKKISSYAFSNGSQSLKLYVVKKSVAADYAKKNGFKTKNVCFIKYAANGGSGYMDTQYVEYGKNAKLSKPAYTKKGYKFKGWCANKKGRGKIYKAGSSVGRLKKNMTLYAVWKK